MATAQEAAMVEASGFVDKVNTIILFPIIYLLSGVAFLVFTYGCVEYVLGAGNDQAREQGKRHIIYGIIGFVVMASAFGILSIAAGTFGLDDELNCADNPTASGCAEVLRFEG